MFQFIRVGCLLCCVVTLLVGCGGSGGPGAVDPVVADMKPPPAVLPVAPETGDPPEVSAPVPGPETPTPSPPEISSTPPQEVIATPNPPSATPPTPPDPASPTPGPPLQIGPAFDPYEFDPKAYGQWLDASIPSLRVTYDTFRDRIDVSAAESYMDRGTPKFLNATFTGPVHGRNRITAERISGTIQMEIGGGIATREETDYAEVYDVDVTFSDGLPFDDMSISILKTPEHRWRYRASLSYGTVTQTISGRMYGSTATRTGGTLDRLCICAHDNFQAVFEAAR